MTAPASLESPCLGNAPPVSADLCSWKAGELLVEHTRSFHLRVEYRSHSVGHPQTLHTSHPCNAVFV